MIIASRASGTDRIRLIAIEMKGAFGNEGALRFLSRRLLAENFVERRQQLIYRFFRFVPHVRKPKGLAFDLAVAGIDHEVMFFAEVAGEFGNVEAPGVFD